MKFHFHRPGYSQGLFQQAARIDKHILPGFDGTLIHGSGWNRRRDRSKFRNSTNRVPPGTSDRNLFTRYLNTGSAGRFENLIWCIEVTGSKAKIYSWSNSGTENNRVMQKVRWKSNDEGKLIGKEVEFGQRAARAEGQ